jgi:membrane associated rhomboid family serine protease
MRSAAVGHQCVDCVQAGAETVRQPRTHFGGHQRAQAPVVTYVLIAVNVAAFALQTAVPGLAGRLALWPPAVADGGFYRLVTSAFVHYGILHLLFNMFALYTVGPALERWLGPLRYVALYALSALGGSVLAYLVSPLNSATAGASGAVFGLFGAIFVVSKRLNLNVRWVAGLIVLNLIITFTNTQQISWQGHVGGLITGTLVGWAYAYAPNQHRNQVQAVATAAVLALFAALIWWRTDELLGVFGRALGLT